MTEITGRMILDARVTAMGSLGPVFVPIGGNLNVAANYRNTGENPPAGHTYDFMVAFGTYVPEESRFDIAFGYYVLDKQTPAQGQVLQLVFTLHNLKERHAGQWDGLVGIGQYENEMFTPEDWYLTEDAVVIAPEPEVRDYHATQWCAWISGTGETICESPGHAIEVGLHDRCGAGRMKFKYQGPPMTIYICYGLEFRGDIAYHGCWGWRPFDVPLSIERRQFSVDIPQDRWWTMPPDVPRRTYSTAKWFAAEPTTDESKFISEVPWDQDKDCYKVI